MNPGEISRSVFAGGIIVSTIALDETKLGEDGRELRYQTTVHKGPWHGYHARYETHDQAIEGHDAVVDRIAPEVLPS